MRRHISTSSSEEEEDQFFSWVVRYPVLCQRVLRDLEMLQAACVRVTGSPVSGGGVSVADVTEGRMVAARLFLVAWESGFEAVAMRFYATYVKYCLMLLAYHHR